MSWHNLEMYKFCPQCGGGLAKRVLKHPEPERLVCTVCGFVFYVDPKLAVIALVPLEGGLVLTRRAIEPGYGLWVAPGGFVDLGETTVEAVVRETQEETLLTVRVARLLNAYSYLGSQTVVLAYITEYLAGTPTAGDETLECRVFRPEEIPWTELAFRSTKEALAEFLQGQDRMAD